MNQSPLTCTCLVDEAIVVDKLMSLAGSKLVHHHTSMRSRKTCDVGAVPRRVISIWLHHDDIELHGGVQASRQR